jgi:ubiquitin-conjugating enzyme E2 Q
LDISWEEAHTIKFNRAKTSHAVQGQVDQMRELETVAETQPDSSTQTPGFLEHDYAMDESESLNILLVATQLGLLRLIRCNQYCMVCHRKAKSAFEAVKPYVCEESLCLYQYLSLGFGQSIEHEIINNPYVIDLLICFFHSAAHDNGFREVPRGLGLMYPYVGDKDGLTPFHEAEANFEATTVRFPVGDDYSYVSMKEGDIILMIVDHAYSNRTFAISSGSKYSFSYGSLISVWPPFMSSLSALHT